ncbi:hypothetical protein [Paenibacillus konkukensis]|uniref:hypothetical protein n=1 Tax=Paenibacillus konkukensis TaxID=2020716 RepID=UPI00201DF1B8|nr:hypothetical protein [Paenibacillus konkukensis]
MVKIVIWVPDDITKTGLYMIHPEFVDKQGEIILDREMAIALEGTARMWVVIPEMREAVHRHRIQPGLKDISWKGQGKLERLKLLR